MKSGVSTSSSGKAGTKEKPLVKERRGIQFDNVHAPYLASHMFQEALANQRLCDVSLIVKKSDMDDAEDDDALPESKVPLKAQASVQALEVETNAEDEDDSATLKFFGGRLVSKLGVDAPDDSKSICIGAHKVVLSLYSPVFDAMLNASQSLNSSANVKAKVHLRDTTVDTLKMVLEILYFDTWQLLMEAKNTNAVVSLLHFAQKYKVCMLACFPNSISSQSMLCAALLCFPTYVLSYHHFASLHCIPSISTPFAGAKSARRVRGACRRNAVTRVRTDRHPHVPLTSRHERLWSRIHQEAC